MIFQNYVQITCKSFFVIIVVNKISYINILTIVIEFSFEITTSIISDIENFG